MTRNIKVVVNEDGILTSMLFPKSHPLSIIYNKNKWTRHHSMFIYQIDNDDLLQIIEYYTIRTLMSWAETFTTRINWEIWECETRSQCRDVNFSIAVQNLIYGEELLRSNNHLISTVHQFMRGKNVNIQPFSKKILQIPNQYLTVKVTNSLKLVTCLKTGCLSNKGGNYLVFR